MTPKKPKVYNQAWAGYYDMWGKTESPWRPNKNDIAFCEKMIKDILKKEKSPKALIFGSTPEIRDLLAKYEIETTVVDVNPTMKKAMDKLMKRKNPKEKLTIDNWLSVKLPEEYFDLVFSDGPLCNIALNTWVKFINNINGSLKKEGLFYLAAWVYQIRNPWRFGDLIAKYKKDPAYFKDFKNRIWSLHRLYQEPGLYNRKKKEFYFKGITKGLEELIRKGVINKIDFGKLQWMKDEDMSSYVEIAFDNIRENDNFLRQFYTIKEIYTDRSHPIMAFRRDYVLKKK
ncbi:MAG: class I SAM-dependent methyltransferase [Candidatus Moranbacteria bacterium]|nr:class I SAM-dependent methyltransferase [Candidatus Moranbacteria bacterium]